MNYKYRPVRFYVIVFTFTWGFWIASAILSLNDRVNDMSDNGSGIATLLMLFGLMTPAATAFVTVLTSGCKELKDDFKRKLVGFYRLKPLNILSGIVLFACITVVSILVSLLFGQPLSQFSFTEDFSFSINGTSALLTILLAAIIEEGGWRGYGEDAVGNYFTWFKESIIFGFVWAAWHIPLFFINGTYHDGLRQLGIIYVLNFLISVVPLDFLTTWVYVKNNRSMLASIIFHLFVNTMQEKIAMTPQTKCIETFVVAGAAVFVVLTNKELFFETRHIGNLLAENTEAAKKG